MSCNLGSEWGLGWSIEIRNGRAMWTDYVVVVYCEKVQGKWGHAACVEWCLYNIYIEIPCLEMSGSNDMAVLNQVCFQTLFIAIPNRIVFHERNGSTTRVWEKCSLKKLAVFSQLATLGAEGGSLYAVLYGITMWLYM